MFLTRISDSIPEDARHRTDASKPLSFQQLWESMQRGESLFDADALKARGLVLNTDKRMLFMANMFGISYVFFYSLVSILIGLFISLPAAYSYSEEILFNRQILAIVICAYMLLNYFLIIIYSSHKQNGRVKHCTLLPVSTKDYCDICDRLMPPRAKHCVLCNVCVLKRDHHCFFAGCCVGFHNQRYFTVFCFYATVGAVYSVYASIQYLKLAYLDPASFVDLCRYFLPWTMLEWIMGYVSIAALSMTIFTYLSTVTFIACLWFFAQQMVLIIRGQTMHEFARGITTYSTSVPAHFTSVFGPFCILNFVIPLPCFKNTGNGTDWSSTKYI